MSSYEKYSQQSQLFIWILNGHQRPIYMCDLGTKFEESFAYSKCLILSKDDKSFSLPKMSYPLKRLREFLNAQKFLSSQMIKRVFHWVQSFYPLKYKSYFLHNSLAKYLWHSIRNWVLHCSICLFQKRSFLLLLLTFEKGLRDWESLLVKHLNTKEGMSLCVSGVVKDLQDSGTPKRVSWGLDVGNGLCRTSIKLCLHSLFPQTLLFIVFYYFYSVSLIWIVI